MIKIIFFVLIIFTIYQHNKVFADDIVSVDEAITFFNSFQKDIEKLVAKISNNKKITKETMVLNYFKKVYSKNSHNWQQIALVDIQQNSRRMDFFSYVKDQLENIEMKKVGKIMSEIHRSYFGLNQYRLISDDKQKENIIKDVKSYIKKYVDPLLPDKLKDLHASVLKSRAGPNLLDKIVEAIYKIDDKERCDDEGSPQDKFYNFYITCISMEFLAMTAMISNYGFNELIKPSNANKKKLKELIAQSKSRMTDYGNEFQLIVGQVPIDYRNCDPYGPYKHEHGVTFLEMTGLYQRVLMYSLYLGKDEESCVACDKVYVENTLPWHNCYSQKDVATPWSEDGIPEKIESCTTPKKCYGKIRKCKTVWKPEYCMMENNPRRYKWINDKYDSDVAFGNYTESCYDGVKEYYEYERIGKLYSSCPFCLCICDDETNESKFTINTISLLPSMSTTSRNRVVVGARLVVQNNIIHIQIKDGKIGQNYLVEKDYYENWIRLPDISKDVNESRSNGGFGKLNRNVDYVSWVWEDNAFNMDEILLEHGRVITGLKFGLIKEKYENAPHKNRIQIQVHSTKYDYKSGDLIKDTDKWHYPDGKHTESGSWGILNPIMTTKKTLIDSETDQYVIMRISDDKTDAGQTTLPLFDAFKIAPVVAAPFSGIGFHHRASNDEYGGFFGLTGYSVDYYKHLSEIYGQWKK